MVRVLQRFAASSRPGRQIRRSLTRNWSGRPTCARQNPWPPLSSWSVLRRDRRSFAPIGVLTHSGASAAKISAALNTEPKPVRHKLAFDEAEAMLTARFAAFLLEPKSEATRKEDIALGLELLATSKAAAGLAAAAQWRLWAARAREGREPRAGFVQAVAGVIDAVRESPLTGDPARDWSFVKRLLRDSGDQELLTAAKNLDYLVAFNRGRRINAELGAIWGRDGCYTDARETLDMALAQDQILGGVDDPPGVQVMTIHKSKGKQFDGVFVIREGRHNGQRCVSSFVWWDDEPPYWPAEQEDSARRHHKG